MGRKTFISWQSYQSFSSAVVTGQRYRLDKECEGFLSAVLETAKSRIEIIKPGSVAFRSQSGCEWRELVEDGQYLGEQIIPYSDKRMLPLSDSAKEGRANPKGIPYLYISNKVETALSESRPWLSSHISLASLEILREQKIVMFQSEQKSVILYGGEPKPEKREKAVWHDIDTAFSRPIENTDATASYVPTQILAEQFKASGYDGIAYRSAFGKGYNITLFDITCVKVKKVEVFNTTDLKYKFSQATNPQYYSDKT